MTNDHLAIEQRDRLRQSISARADAVDVETGSFEIAHGVPHRSARHAELARNR
jgi:hypothetical protein